MDYSTFVKKLTSGLERQILAFDYNEEADGCLIYLTEPPGHIILIPGELIEHRCDDVLGLLRARIQKAGEAGIPHERVAEVDGELVLASSSREETPDGSSGDGNRAKPGQCA